MTTKKIKLSFLDNEEISREIEFTCGLDKIDILERRVTEFLKLCFTDSFDQWESKCSITITTEPINEPEINKVNS